MQLTTSPVHAPLANPTVVTCLAIGPEGRDVIVGQAADGDHPSLTRWSLPDLTRLPGPEPCPLSTHQDTCWVLARGGNSLLAVAGMSAQQLILIDLSDGTQTAPVDGDVVWAALTGSLLASSGTHTQIADLDSGRLVWRQEPPAPRKPSHASLAPLIAFHPNQQTFAVGGAGEPNVVVYPLSGGEPVTTLSGAPERLRWLGFGPQGRYLMAIDAYAQSTTLWRSGESEPHRPGIPETGRYRSAAFHPDGEHCVLAMRTGYVHLYRLSDGALLDRQQHHRGRVQALSFTPDGSLLLSGGDDGKLLAWTVS